MSETVWAEHANRGAVANHFVGVMTNTELSRLAIPAGSAPSQILLRIARRDLGHARATTMPTNERLRSHDDPAINDGLLRPTLEAALRRDHNLPSATLPGRHSVPLAANWSEG